MRSRAAQLPRPFNLAFYLIAWALAIVFLYFFLHFNQVSTWVFWLYFAGFLLVAIAVIQRELTMRKRVRADGTEPCPTARRWWGAGHGALHLIALGLIITAFIFTIIQSDLPAYVWWLLILSWIFGVLGSVIHTYFPDNHLWGALVHIIALGLSLTAFVFIIITSNGPYWQWLIYAASLLFFILAGSSELVNAPNEVVIHDECESECNPCNPCESSCDLTYDDDGITELANVAIITSARPIPVATVTPLPAPVPAVVGSTSQVSYSEQQEQEIKIANPHATYDPSTQSEPEADSETPSVSE